MQSLDLISRFSDLKDPRIERTKRYPLIEIIFLIISATIVIIDFLVPQVLVSCFKRLNLIYIF